MNPTVTNPEATKAMLKAEYRMRANRVKNIRIHLSTTYRLVLGQCTDYLSSRLKGQYKWEEKSTDRDLFSIIKTVKLLLHKYDEDTEYHHVVGCTLLRRFMLFRKGNSLKWE